MQKKCLTLDAKKICILALNAKKLVFLCEMHVSKNLCVGGLCIFECVCLRLCACVFARARGSERVRLYECA